MTGNVDIRVHALCDKNQYLKKKKILSKFVKIEKKV